MAPGTFASDTSDTDGRYLSVRRARKPSTMTINVEGTTMTARDFLTGHSCAGGRHPAAGAGDKRASGARQHPALRTTRPRGVSRLGDPERAQDPSFARSRRDELELRQCAVDLRPRF